MSVLFENIFFVYKSVHGAQVDLWKDLFQTMNDYSVQKNCSSKIFTIGDV